MEEGRERPHFAYPSGWVVRHALDGSVVIGSWRLSGRDDSLALSLSRSPRGPGHGRPADGLRSRSREKLCSVQITGRPGWQGSRETPFSLFSLSQNKTGAAALPAPASGSMN